MCAPSSVTVIQYSGAKAVGVMGCQRPSAKTGPGSIPAGQHGGVLAPDGAETTLRIQAERDRIVRRAAEECASSRRRIRDHVDVSDARDGLRTSWHDAAVRVAAVPLEGVAEIWSTRERPDEALAGDVDL